MGERLSDNERLTRARAQLFILRSAEEDLQECVRGLRGHEGGDLPRGSPACDALERGVIRREALEAAVRVERARLLRYQREARRIIGRMDRRRALFALRRYIYGEEIKAIKTALAGEVSSAQIDRYKKQIEG